jgi:hypothetical protein
MEQASEFDDQESLIIPADHILAIIMDSDEATGIVETLKRNGFSPNDIGVLSGMEDAAKLDAACGKKGFFAKLATAGVDLGDRDTDYIKQYRRAVLNGQQSWLSQRKTTTLETEPDKSLGRVALVSLLFSAGS